MNKSWLIRLLISLNTHLGDRATSWHLTLVSSAVFICSTGMTLNPALHYEASSSHLSMRKNRTGTWLVHHLSQIITSSRSNNSSWYIQQFYETLCQVFTIEHARPSKGSRAGWEPITFNDERELGVIFPHDDPYVIRTDIFNFDVGRILVNTGNSINVMFSEAFSVFQIPGHLLDKTSTPLMSFFNDVIQPIGSINLPIIISSAPQRARTTTPFLIVDCPIAYNDILGCLGLAQLQVEISIYMFMLKFPIMYGIGTVHRDQLRAQSCYAPVLKSVKVWGSLHGYIFTHSLCQYRTT